MCNGVITLLGGGPGTGIESILESVLAQPGCTPLVCVKDSGGVIRMTPELRSILCRLQYRLSVRTAGVEMVGRLPPGTTLATASLQAVHTY